MCHRVGVDGVGATLRMRWFCDSGFCPLGFLVQQGWGSPLECRTIPRWHRCLVLVYLYNPMAWGGLFIFGDVAFCVCYLISVSIDVRVDNVSVGSINDLF